MLKICIPFMVRQAYPVSGKGQLSLILSLWFDRLTRSGSPFILSLWFDKLTRSGRGFIAALRKIDNHGMKTANEYLTQA
jgi:hypothetical protein